MSADVGRGRYSELDGLRGIAASAVVLYHVFSEYDVNFTPGTPPAPVRFSHGYFGVQLFFLISGYVILLTAQRSRRPVDFVVARFSRLYPTYWVCLTTAWVAAALCGLAGLARTPVEIAVNYSMLQRFLGIRSVDGAYWSLSVELVFYALVLVVLLARGEITAVTVRRLVPAWLLVALAVSLVVHAHPDSGAVRMLSVLTVAEFAALFCCGMVLVLSRRSGHLEPLVPVCVAAAFLDTWLTSSLGAAVVVTTICVAFCVVVMLPGVPLLRSRPLLFLGEISYPLYVVHQNVAYIVLERLVHHVDRTVAGVAAIAVAVALAWVIHLSVETVASRWLRDALGRLTHGSWDVGIRGDR